jgi:hypothetical protein
MVDAWVLQPPAALKLSRKDHAGKSKNGLVIPKRIHDIDDPLVASQNWLALDATEHTTVEYDFNNVQVKALRKLVPDSGGVSQRGMYFLDCLMIHTSLNAFEYRPVGTNQISASILGVQP